MTDNFDNMQGITKENVWFFLGAISSHVDPKAWESTRIMAVNAYADVTR